MIKISNLLFVMLLTAIALVTACEPSSTKQQGILGALTRGPWRLTHYTLPEGTETISDPEVTIDFSPSTFFFTVTKPGFLPNPHAINDIFPASGTYRFADADNPNTIQLNASGSRIPFYLTDVVVDENNGNKSLSFKYQGVVVESQPIEVIVHAVPK